MSTPTTLSEQERHRLRLPAPTPADPIAGWRTARARTLTWLWRHRVSLAIVLPLLAVVAIVRLWGLSHGPALADDEGTYVAQAWAVQVQHALAPYTYWYDHPPLGWIQLAGFTWVTGTFGGHGLAIVAVRRLMVGYAVLDAGLLFVLARRFGLRRGWAAAVVGLWALSPLAVGYSRMVYLDNIALPWALAAFVLASTKRHSLWSQVTAGLCFAVAVLSKETMILLLPGLLLVVRRHTARQTRAFCLTGFAAAGLLVLAVYPLLALLKGELLPGSGHVSLFDALRFQFLTRPSTGSALSAGNGSRVVLDSWLSLDGWLLVAGLVATPVCLGLSRLRPIGVSMLVLLLAGVRPGYLPQPFVITVLPFGALAAGAALDAAWQAGRPRLFRTVTSQPTHTEFRVARGTLGRPGVVRAVVAVVCLAAVAAVGPAWLHGNRALAGPDQSATTLAAEHWLEQHRSAAGRGADGLPRDVLVDDTAWADLVTHGYPPRQVVWFYKLDYVNNLDPSVRRRISSYSAFGLVVSTPVIRSALATSSTQTFTIVRQALAHSRVLATFGSGSARIEVRQVAAAASHHVHPSASTRPSASNATKGSQS